jgi:hypothetical protein
VIVGFTTANGPSPMSYTNRRFCTPIWGAAKPTPGASYMVTTMSSTSLTRSASMSRTGSAG